MAGSEIYTVFRNLTVAAGDTRTINVTGRFWAVLEATLDFEIGFDDDATQFVAAGLAAQGPVGEGFKSIRVHNPNGSALTVTLGVSNGEIRDQRLTTSAPIKLEKATGLTSPADVSIAATTTASVIAVNTNRRYVEITNLSGNVREVRIGDAGAGAAEGRELLPGKPIRLHTTAEVFAYNPHSAAQSLSVVEVPD